MPAANPNPIESPGGPLASQGTTYTAGHGDNKVVVTCAKCTNNSWATAGVCEIQNGFTFLGSAVLAVYNVVPGQPANGQCTVIVNSGWPTPIKIHVSVIYSTSG
jgi:hypothetical protein